MLYLTLEHDPVPLTTPQVLELLGLRGDSLSVALQE